MTQLGQQLAEGLSPAAGPCGAVALRGVALPPPESKWADFRPLEDRVRVRYDGKEHAGTPELLSTLDVNDNGVVRALLVGAAVSGAAVAVSSICLYNAYKALLARGFREPKYQPAPGTGKLMESFIDHLLPELANHYVDTCFYEWVATMRPARQRPLWQAWNAYQQGGWRGKYRLFSSFVKSEKLVGFSKGDYYLEKLDRMLDRLINGPHDVTHVIAGPMLKPVTKAVKKVWNCDNHIFYAAVEPAQLDYWFNTRYRDGKVALLCDYTRYDNSHNHQTWDFIEEIYRRLGLFEKEPMLKTVLDCWREPEGSLRGKGWEIFFKAYVMNASGRDDTGLANAILNGFAMYIALVAAFLRRPPHSLSPEDCEECKDLFDISVMGDDSLVLMDASVVTADFTSRVSHALSLMGLEAKVSLAYTPFDMVYLGMRPYLVDGVYWWGKTIGRALFKWGWKLQPNQCDAPAWLTGVATHDVTCSKHVPILSDLAQAYLVTRAGCKRTPHVLEECKPWAVGNPRAPAYDSTTIVYTAHGYDVSVAELEDCLRYVSTLSTFPCIIDHPVIDAIMLKDDY